MSDDVSLADEWVLLTGEQTALLAEHARVKDMPHDMKAHARHKERLREHLDRLKAYQRRPAESHLSLRRQSDTP
jgi:hypothetical protein